MNSEQERKDGPAKAIYEAPTITTMSDEEVLRMFQITASQIGAAASWWTPSC